MPDAEVTPPGPRPVDDRFFRYWDGTKERLGDPLAIGRKLERACPDYLDQLAVATRTVPAALAGSMSDAVAADLRGQKDEANDKLLAATRAAFAVPEPELKNGAAVGLSEDECARLLLAFLFWMERAAGEPQVAVFSTSQPRASPSIPADSTPADSPASGSNGT